MRYLDDLSCSMNMTPVYILNLLYIILLHLFKRF